MTIPESIIANPRTPYSDKAPFIMHYWSSAYSQPEIANCMNELLENGWSQSCRKLIKQFG
jgi:hypothetical protein